MPIEYKNIRAFVQKGIDLYIQPIHRFFMVEINRENTNISITDERIDNEISTLTEDVETIQLELDGDITTLNTTLSTQAAIPESQINQHLLASNPHNTKLKDLLSISTSDPTSGQGVNGNVWLTYIN